MKIHVGDMKLEDFFLPYSSLNPSTMDALNLLNQPSGKWVVLDPSSELCYLLDLELLKGFFPKAVVFESADGGVTRISAAISLDPLGVRVLYNSQALSTAVPVYEEEAEFEKANSEEKDLPETIVVSDGGCTIEVGGVALRLVEPAEVSYHNGLSFMTAKLMVDRVILNLTRL